MRKEQRKPRKRKHTRKMLPDPDIDEMPSADDAQADDAQADDRVIGGAQK